MRHFLSAIKKVMPSMQKGSECTVDFTPVKWEDIGGLEKVKAQLQQVFSLQKFVLTLELGGTFV